MNCILFIFVSLSLTRASTTSSQALKNNGSKGSTHEQMEGLLPCQRREPSVLGLLRFKVQVKTLSPSDSYLISSL